MRLLLVEDSNRLRGSLEEGLTRGGFSVDAVSDGGEAAALLRSNPFDLVVLDVGLPTQDGLTILRDVRARGDSVPVLLLTARDATEQVVEGFDAGADDYLVKPFVFDELLVRCRALVRRRFGAPRRVVRVGELELDLSAHTLKDRGRDVPLTARDFKVLEALALHAGEVVSREALEDHVYRLEELPSSNAIDTAIYSLRKKLYDGAKPSRIETVRGLGYVLRARSADEGAPE